MIDPSVYDLDMGQLKQLLAEREATINELHGKVERLQSDLFYKCGCQCHKNGAIVTQCAIHEQVSTALTAAEARVLAWEQAAQQGHPSPCTLGPLCPYCEIERLQEQLDKAPHGYQCASKVSFVESGPPPDYILSSPTAYPCDCWKSKLAGAT